MGASKKEIHFFSDHYDKGYRWYKNHFPSLFKKYRQALACQHRVITGESTPYYMFHPHAPGRIKHLFPRAKIIMMLRNPADRAYSHYRYHVKLGTETLTFEEAIGAEQARLQGELEKMLEDKHYNSTSYKLFSYLQRGIYIEQVKCWFKLFSREQILIARSEDFFTDPAACLSTAQDFLGLPRRPLSSYKTFNPGASSPISPDTRKRLLEYFRPHNQCLYELLDKDFNWD